MRIFSANGLCVSVEDVDFHNPKRQQDGRECGVRLELRVIEEDARPGSIYVSRAFSIGRAVCRFDLLESAPNAQDRMHWHPQMNDGEPCRRVFDEDLAKDPLGWLGARLRDGMGLLEIAGVEAPERFADDVRELARIADAVVADTAATLNRFRTEPWPLVEHRDDRGMPLAS
jgi:hypothetical protein